VLTGSQRKADSLIAGLRDGKNILLVTNPTGPNPTTSSVIFTPATGSLGCGNIDIALSLATADLARRGITNPTPVQLAVALNGGTIAITSGTTVAMASVLAQCKAGLGANRECYGRNTWIAGESIQNGQGGKNG
jgi:hypothetical protein